MKAARGGKLYYGREGDREVRERVNEGEQG